MLSQVSKRELTDTVRLRYLRANKTQQAKILDEFVAVTGYHRKYAIHLLNHPQRSKPKGQRRRQRTDTATIIPPLTLRAEPSRAKPSRALVRTRRTTKRTSSRKPALSAGEGNWSIVRQLVGYDRYEKEAVGPLNALYRVLHLYTNFFQPVLQLKEKIRVDGKVKKASPLRALARRVYDEAQTPYQRTLASPHVRQEDKDRLTELYRTLDPVALREDLDRRLRDLWENYRVRSLHEATIPPK